MTDNLIFAVDGIGRLFSSLGYLSLVSPPRQSFHPAHPREAPNANPYRANTLAASEVSVGFLFLKSIQCR